MLDSDICHRFGVRLIHHFHDSCFFDNVHCDHGSKLCKCYVPVNSKTAHPPRANPGAFNFLEKFWSNSPLCCQFRRSNAPPVRSSKKVKSPALQACRENRIASFGNKFCKIFSHYEFLVLLVFAPRFNKQRHIPRCHYIKR